MNANTGANMFTLPIQVAPGVNGLQPNLQLSYNSARVDDTAPNTASPWVGAGWDLSMPSIARSGTKYFLNTGGAGTELIQASDYSTSHKWLTKNQLFLDITHDATCDDTNQDTLHNNDITLPCSWTIRDQSGRTSVFGDGTWRMD